MKKELVKLTEKDLHGIIKESVKRIINERTEGTLDDVIELLVDAYENINNVTKQDKSLRFEIASSLNGIRNAVRIIRNINLKNDGWIRNQM